MRRTLLAATAMVAIAATALPAGAQPEDNENWHVHDVTDDGKQSTVQLKSAPVVFFPELFSQEGDTYEPATDPVVCPDATDKAGTRPNGRHTNRHHVNGVCHTDAYVIHLRSAAGGSDQAPAGWGSLSWSQQTIHYRLTARA